MRLNVTMTIGCKICVVPSDIITLRTTSTMERLYLMAMIEYVVQMRFQLLSLSSSNILANKLSS